MPCDSVRVIKVEFGLVNLERLEKLLLSQGYQVSRTSNSINAYSPSGDRFQVRKGEKIVSTSLTPAQVQKLKRDYAGQTIQDASAKFGFKVQSKQELAGGALKIKLGR